MDALQTEVKKLIDRRSEAIRGKDIERLMSVYAADTVYFDLVPPLRYIGEAALRKRFLEWFEGWKSAIRQEVRDLHIVASGNVAAAHMLVRSGGTRNDGQEVDYWVRASDSFQRSERGWLITHEHISLPVDVRTRTAATDLAP